MDEQVGLRGRLSLTSSLVVESSSNSTFLVGGGDLRGGSSKVIGFQEGVLVGIRLRFFRISSKV